MRFARPLTACLMLAAAAIGPASYASSFPLSDYFTGDSEASEIASGVTSVEFFATSSIDAFDVRWRIQNALRMLGYERSGMPYGETIDAARILQIDADLAAKEDVIGTQASRIPNWEDLWTVDFIDNIPQEFAVHFVATIFDLFNASETPYQSHTIDCVRANFVPQMCGALIDMGTVTGESCKNVNVPLLDPITIQTPELFGFNNVRREILADEYPTTAHIASTYSYVATLVHEFVHDLQWSSRYSSVMQRDWDRADVCGTFYLDQNQVDPTPFRYDGPNGDQDIGEFVSYYASGLSNVPPTYFWWEDHAESVTAYLLLPEYFRDRTRSNPRLREKYEYIRDYYFDGVEFSNPALVEQPGPYAVPTTLPQFYSDNGITHFDVDSIAASRALPTVISHKIIDCDSQTEIATVPNGGFFILDLDGVGNPSCIGIGVLTDAKGINGDGSVGHDYIPASGEVVTTPYEGESSQPFAFPGEMGWAVQNEIAACHCAVPTRGDLTHPGVHRLVSTPCSADTVSWASGDKTAQCMAAGGQVGDLYTTTLFVPEPDRSLLLFAGAGLLAGLHWVRRFARTRCA